MADEEQAQHELPPQSPIQSQPEDATSPVDAAPQATTTQESAEQPEAEQPDVDELRAEDGHGSIDAAPSTSADANSLTTVVRSENTDAAAQTAAIFDEDDEDDDQDLPSFRRREARDAAEDGTVRKKKKKRHHSPLGSPVHASATREPEPEEEEDPYANMTEAESKYRSNLDR